MAVGRNPQKEIDVGHTFYSSLIQDTLPEIALKAVVFLREGSSGRQVVTTVDLMSLGPATTAQVGAANVLPADGGATYLFTYLPNYSPTYLLAYILPTYLITYLITNIKGVHKKNKVA